MRSLIWILGACAVLCGQVQQPQPRYYPTDDEKHRIETRLGELHTLLRGLESNPLYADVAIYHKAGQFILAHPEEFVQAAFVEDTLNVLDKGIARAKELAA